jgi:hypothetical protein
MAKIEHYHCDFCGVKVDSLTELEPLDIQMDSATVHQEYTYQVCPWCAGTFTNLSTKELFFTHIKTNFVLDEE